MHNWQPLWTAFRTFSADEAGGTFMEYTLLAALAIVVGFLLLLAIRKVAVAPA